MSPLVVPRDDHGLSRRQIDPDALKVLYRLKEAGFKAYLVGGGVRDLLLGRRPKDFDVGTDAHPHQIKKLFRNAWIIGRRFRLVHVKFGNKTIEVATFRRQIDETEAPDATPRADVPPQAATAAERAGDAMAPTASAPPDAVVNPDAGHHDRRGDHHRHHAVHHDNTFGTDEEDAFRRDFTINALFYDIATFSVIDYVGGLDDLKAGVIRCIGDPDVRFREDPVRMQRAVAFAARLGFTLDAPVKDAVGRLGHLLAGAAPARLMDEYYKILRTGHAETIFRALRKAGLLKALSPILHDGAGTSAFKASVERLDACRQSFEEHPEFLTNAILLGSMLVPLGFSQGAWPIWMENADRPGLNLGVVPLARRDVERLHQVLVLQKRLLDPSRSTPARRSLMRRPAFEDALVWLEVHGDAPDTAYFWREQMQGEDAAPLPDTEASPRRRRRRSGRRRHRGPQPA